MIRGKTACVIARGPRARLARVIATAKTAAEGGQEAGLRGGAMEVAESDPGGAVNVEKLDHMLGYLSLSSRRPEVDGLRPGLANSYQGHGYPVHHLAATALGMDPDHSADAIDQQVAGGEMSGFVASAAATLAAHGIA